MNKQSAKDDTGKLKIANVDVKDIEALALIKEFDDRQNKNAIPRMIQKTRKENGLWKAEFECVLCGAVFEAYICNVNAKKTKTCGCQRPHHGGAGTRLYKMYIKILSRCRNENDKAYKYYGARGIKFKFMNFEHFRDFSLKNGYHDNLSIERIDVNGHYEPSNIEFIEKSFQSKNRRGNLLITYKGLTLCASEWGKILGCKEDTMIKRKKAGWEDDKILEEKIKSIYPQKIDIKLVPISIIEEIYRVRKFGLFKYDEVNNWQQVEPERYKHALFRHFLKYLEDETSVDNESGLSHLAHMATNICFLIEFANMKEQERTQ